MSRRVKVRLRWYDEAFAQRGLFFEVKRRSGQVTMKDRTPLEAHDRISNTVLYETPFDPPTRLSKDDNTALLLEGKRIPLGD